MTPPNANPIPLALEGIITILTYLLIGLALVSLWFSRRPVLWGILLGGAVIAGLAAHRIEPIALAPIALFGGLTFIYYRTTLPSNLKLATGLGILLMAGLLSLHRLPGFDNWRVIKNLQLSPDSLPYSLYFNFDKTLIGLFILAFGQTLIRSRQDWRRMFQAWIPAFALGAVSILLASYALGYIRFDPKFPEMFWIWLPKMLLFTCLAEEALFRGFIQKELAVLWTPHRWGRAAALVIASVLFGLSHFAGGWKYILLATLAGLFYGGVYMKTDRIESSVLFHFSLNTLHLLLFSYPSLSSAP